MALSGAIATLALLQEEHEHLHVVFVSDSQYLVKGMNEWMPSWRARGWRRKGGEVENVRLWKRLEGLSKGFSRTPEWQWVRGHAGHPKNEYCNDLAIQAAREQAFSQGTVESSFDEWLAGKQAAGRFVNYDPDEHFNEMEASALKR
jgi:ribonuclease HI